MRTFFVTVATVLVVTCTFFFACKKDTTSENSSTNPVVAPPPPPAPVPDTLEKKLVTSLMADTTGGRNNSPFLYYDLEENKQISDPKSVAWGIKLDARDGSKIGINNTMNAGADTAKGGMYFRFVLFDSLHLAAPDPNYDIFVNKGIDSMPKRKELQKTYFMESVFQAAQPVTYVVRTGRGNYAKMEIISKVSKKLSGGENTWIYSFRYAIQKNGSWILRTVKK